VIGERVQVGSDCTLVAPVTIADDAYIATATTVRRDVSAGALALNPRTQEERPGWVSAFRARKTAGRGGRAVKPAPARGKAKPTAGKVAPARRRRRAR